LFSFIFHWVSKSNSGGQLCFSGLPFCFISLQVFLVSSFSDKRCKAIFILQRLSEKPFLKKRQKATLPAGKREGLHKGGGEERESSAKEEEGGFGAGKLSEAARWC